LEAVIDNDGPQVVRVPADDPWASLRIMLTPDTAVNVQHRQRVCIGQRRRFDRLYYPSLPLTIALGSVGSLKERAVECGVTRLRVLLR
jgi:hypothetical protein